MRLCLFVCLENSRLVGNSFRNSVHINRLPDIIAYSIRCQLSHLRMMKLNDVIKKKQAVLAAGVPEATCNDSPELKELLDLLPTGVCRSDRTVLSQMPMPFLLFQEKAESDDDGCEELPDEPEVVWKILRYLKEIVIAIMLMSNGMKVAATRYEKGNDGCIICHWDDHQENLVTNMPNELLSENAQFINLAHAHAPKTTPTKKKYTKPTPAVKTPNKTKKTIMKKPAASKTDEQPDTAPEVQFVAAL
jgi:hypothetical protein